MVINATFNNISGISWWSVLLVEKTGENHRLVASHWQSFITYCWGTDVGSLRVSAIDNNGVKTSLWYASDEQEDGWLLSCVPINKESSVILEFEVTQGSDSDSFIAVDNITVSCEPFGRSKILPLLKVPSVPPVNFQNLPAVKKIKYKQILTYILRSIFLEIPHLELLRWRKTQRDTNGKGESHI
jgi:hypothetical protein